MASVTQDSRVAVCLLFYLWSGVIIGRRSRPCLIVVICGRLQKELFCAVFIGYFLLCEQLKVQEECLDFRGSGFTWAFPFLLLHRFVLRSLLNGQLTLRLICRFWAKKPYVDPKRIGIWGWVSVFFNYPHSRFVTPWFRVSVSNWNMVVYFNPFLVTVPGDVFRRLAHLHNVYRTMKKWFVVQAR